MNQCILQKETYLLLHLILWNTLLSKAEPGVCVVRGARGGSIEVCCADYEERHSKCKPCLDGYVSEIGQKCKPCPQNFFGRTCVEKCDCNEIQRCDHIRGCVSRNKKQETSSEIYQTTILIKKDFTTVTAVYDSSDSTTKAAINEVSGCQEFNTFTSKQNLQWWLLPSPLEIKGLSSKQMVMYYFMSVSVIILIVCLCVVIIKCKTEQKRRIIQIRNQEHVEMEDTHLYEEIDVEDINLEAGLISNDYLEVVAKSWSSSSSSSSKDNDEDPQSYLNPYQPLVSNDDMKHSYEKLHLQPKGVVYDDDILNVDVMDKNTKETSYQSSMLTSYENKHYYIETTSNLDRMCVKGNDNANGRNSCKFVKMTTTATFGNTLRSISSCDVRKDMFSDLSPGQKHQTF